MVNLENTELNIIRYINFSYKYITILRYFKWIKICQYLHHLYAKLYSFWVRNKAWSFYTNILIGSKFGLYDLLTEDKTNEKVSGSSTIYNPIKLPNLSFKPAKGADHESNHGLLHNTVNCIESSDGLGCQDVDDSSIERLPSAKGRIKVSRNSKVHKSRSMLSKNDDSVGNDDDTTTKMPPPKRKIRIIHNSKGTKEPNIKNSHMIILKSIKKKLNMQGMLKDNE